jgi:hypothetical protein
VARDGVEADTTDGSKELRTGRSNLAEPLRTCPDATGFLRGGDFEAEREEGVCSETGAVGWSTMTGA